MTETALARHPPAGRPADDPRAQPAAGPASRALQDTAALLNARPASVAQRALVAQLARTKNVKRKQEGEQAPKTDEKENKRVKKSPPLVTFDDESEYSDSEQEAIDSNHEPASRYKGQVLNYTKTKPKVKKKVRNKVRRNQLATAKGKLMDHANAILNALKNPKSKGGTTITTALLFHQATQTYKKFAFSNLPLMQQECRQKAETLGYHVIKAPQTHAEGELIEYLYVRGEVYTHEDMGVDKDHCHECQILMKTYFGHDEYGTEAGKSGTIFDNYHSSPLLHEAVGRVDQPITEHRDKEGNRVKVETTPTKKTVPKKTNNRKGNK